MPDLEAMTIRYVLACLRLAPAVVIPGLSVFTWAPALIRIVILLVMASVLVLAPAAPEGDAATASVRSLGNMAAVEFMLGLALAFALALPAAALAFSGRLIDTQSGFSAANLLNPGHENEAESLLGTALALSASVLFFSLDLHLDLLAMVVKLGELTPIGAAGWSLDTHALLGAVSLQFALGLMVALPVVLTMFAIDLGTAYATRSMPQANVYFLALPLKVFAALLVIASSAKYFPHLIGRMYSESLHSIFRIVH